MMGARYQFTGGLILLGWCLCVHSLPISVAPPQENLEPQQNWSVLHYKRYVMEVERLLKQDPQFRAKMKNSTIDEILTGKLNHELDHMHIDIRAKLDELKREELNRLRAILKVKHAIAEEKGHVVDRQAALKQFEHLNYRNPDKFEMEDLDLMMRGINKHMEQLDESRRDEFKAYQMMKEHERRAYLKSLSEEERLKEEQRDQEIKQKHGNHPKINHPGSEDQLKEVWQETDSLDPEDFDPKTFFKLHDSNGDGFLDESELEALFTKEVEKVHGIGTEDDAIQIEEERIRMKNHVMAEVDADGDRLVSHSEFMELVKRDDFSENEEWETLEQNPGFTEEEMNEFEQKLAAEMDGKGEELQEAVDEVEKLEVQRSHPQVSNA